MHKTADMSKDSDWRKIACEYHEWIMLMFQFKKDVERRTDGFEYWSHCDEIDRAQDVFTTQYHLALACKYLAQLGIADDRLIALVLDTNEIMNRL